MSFSHPTPLHTFTIKMLTLKEYFIELHRQEKETEEKLGKIRNAIKSGQEVCDHDYKYVGNTHKDIYECKICLHRTSV